MVALCKICSAVRYLSHVKSVNMTTILSIIIEHYKKSGKHKKYEPLYNVNYGSSASNELKVLEPFKNYTGRIKINR